MLNKLKKQFFSGLVIFVPLSLTVYFFWLFFLLMSQTLLPLVVHQHWIDLPLAYFRPISFALTILLIWLLGVVVSNYFGKRMITGMESAIHHIPIIRGLYEAIQKMTEAFFGVNSIYQSVVLVEYPRLGTYTLGFVTSQVSGKVFQGSEPYLCVFIPTVPNPTSGILLYIPTSQTIPLSLTMEEAAKILVSHGFVPIEERSLQRKEKHV